MPQNKNEVPWPEKALNEKYDYDLIVIGGGSGGLAASKEAVYASGNKAKVACFDFVDPSPQGTKWGLGGTCVNVGCIPKKLMHYSALLGAQFEHAKTLGWNLDVKSHSWDTMRQNVNNYIMGLNNGYEGALDDGRVQYINARASFKDAHTVEYELDGKTCTATADKFIIAVGGRPKFPKIPGAMEYGITSDDLFWWEKPLGKTLLVGASYIALECGGFLHEQKVDVSVMVRSILLRGYDKQCALQIGEFMERQGVRFVPGSPNKMEKLDGADGPITVTYAEKGSDVQHTEKYDTVVFAIGRTSEAPKLNLDTAGVALKWDQIVTNEFDQTNVANIYAIGDVCLDRPELTPVAIQAGKLLARRLFAGSLVKMDYVHVPTTVFTPLEYGAVGLSQEDAIKQLGADNVEVFHQRYGALESAVTYVMDPPQKRSSMFTGANLYHAKFMKEHGGEWEDLDPESFEAEERAGKFAKQPLLAKLVCDKKNNNKVIGFHYVGPNAGEITQGFALAVKCGATKADFDNLVGIHPTTAEEFTTMSISLSSGEDFLKKGGC